MSNQQSNNKKPLFNKTTIIALAALIAAVALLVGIYFMTKPRPENDDKDDTKQTVNEQKDDSGKAIDGEEETTLAGDTFTLVVVHGDGTEKTFTITSEEDYLAPALITEGILTDEGVETGMYNTVDGETADWNADQAYWAFYIDDEYATYGMNDTPIEEGGNYKLVYTVGF